MSTTFNTRQYTYGGETTRYFHISIDINSEVPCDLMKHVKRYAIKRACDLMAKDEQTEQDCNDAIEYIEIAKGISEMFDELEELEPPKQEEASDDKG